ncbi:uncharacterized protein LOC107433425 [Ziziphus jujuba]|uniref:Uncharacterized protein LOC107433425 n=1 Tax=Ziziphus jujuba TaxID=326968 RepID=A0A6P4APF2_ZIZJJ|nr:uncharacterized protein LOC107433425 [Ziziphus jujuba]
MADWGGVYSLAHQQWVSSAPLIPLDFPEKKMSVGFADWRNLYLLAEICDQQPDWSNLYLLADVCDQQLTPLIPFNFPKRKRSPISSYSKTTTTRRKPLIFKVSRTSFLGKRCRFIVDDDDLDGDDLKGKKKMKMKMKMKMKQTIKVSRTSLLGKRCHFIVDDDDLDGDDLKGRKKMKMKQTIIMGGSDIFSTSNGVVDHRSKHKEETSAASFQTETNPNPPRRFMDRIQQLGGSEVKFLIQKTLSVTDVKKDQNRLSMPFSQIHSDFLTPQERMFLSRKEDDGKHYQGMEVMVIEPCLDQSSLCLKKWDYRSSSFSYVLIKNWYNLVVNNGLQPGMVVQIWSFRVENALCLALVNLS